MRKRSVSPRLARLSHVLARTYKCMSMVLNQEKSDGLSRTTESPDILDARCRSVNRSFVVHMRLSASGNTSLWNVCIQAVGAG